tara:strand:- start:2984 stop:4519 length:1536 start_codon:yes stop_codon:yes gene_type:complete
MIYFTIIGNHDTYITNQRPFETGGAAFTIFQNYKEKIDKVFIFTTTTFENTTSPFQDAAELTKKIIKQEKSSVDVQIINMDFTPSPIDYDIVYNEMLSVISELIETKNINKDEKLINITSGTATMTACWLLLQQSGIIKKAKLLQSFSKEIQRKRGIAVEEVDFNIPRFPKAKINKSIENKLSSISTKNTKLKDQLIHQGLHDAFPGMIGRSISLSNVKKQIISLAKIDNPTLVLGEAGTGKELVARALHQKSDRKDKAIVTVNFAGKETQLIESELFGHKKGSFTDASRDRDGVFKSADKGTLFIDEIGDMPLGIQERLLRVIEYGEIKPVGSDKVEKVDVRIIGATNQDINKLVQKKLFRKDFLSRFGAYISIPPLRDRKEDIEDLIRYFGGQELNLSEKCLKAFNKKDWENGNVRELKAVVDMASTIVQDKPLEWKDIPSIPTSLLNSLEDDMALPALPLPVPLPEYIDAIINKARSISKSHVDVDRLLKQKNVEKARVSREKKKLDQ